ncbi:hypothetical protein ACOSQ2_000299 [Xanthoceras sorbifolium]|uniref:GDSL esterase/lipase n=1 Tax=Xanthoceras sorbifolium TaxID=99658 RepID=A0ABQ8IQ89_9ROSI|nr:hypothetical protein JRO89_XS01G0382400 [Xanthoceras sorbifolium]
MAAMHFLLLFFIHILVQPPKTVAKVHAIIVFGDSSVDTGNNNYIPTIAKCDFEPYGRDFPGGTPTGRFCNGRLPPDFLSESFGLKPAIPAYLDPMYNISDFASGVCFASAATGYDNATADILKKQTCMHMTSHPFSFASSTITVSVMEKRCIAYGSLS